LLPVLLALALAEVVWGALWWQLVPAHAWPLQRARRRPVLPYIQPASPAAQVFGWPEPGAVAAIARAGLPLAILAILLSLPVGRAALWLTGAVLLIVLLAMPARQAGLRGLTGWLQAAVQAGLPFALGVILHGQWPSAPLNMMLPGLGAGYLLLARSVLALPVDASEGSLPHLLLAAAGFGVVATVLLVENQLLAAGGVGLLAVAPLLVLAGVSDRKARLAQPWMLAAVLLSSVAIGFGIA
jgi:hypothetical protein